MVSEVYVVALRPRIGRERAGCWYLIKSSVVQSCACPGISPWADPRGVRGQHAFEHFADTSLLQSFGIVLVVVASSGALTLGIFSGLLLAQASAALNTSYGCQVSENFVRWIQYSLLIWVLLETLDVLSTYVLVVGVIASGYLLKIITCLNCSIWVIFCERCSVPRRTTADLMYSWLVGRGWGTSSIRSTLGRRPCLIQASREPTQLFPELQSSLLACAYSRHLRGRLVLHLQLPLRHLQLLRRHALVRRHLLILQVLRKIAAIDNEAIVINIYILHGLYIEYWPILLLVRSQWLRTVRLQLAQVVLQL